MLRLLSVCIHAASRKPALGKFTTFCCELLLSCCTVSASSVSLIWYWCMVCVEDAMSQVKGKS